MVSTGKFLLKEALMTELYLQLFSLYLMYKIQGCCYGVLIFHRKVCKYTVCCGALVAFNLCIDLAEMNISWDSMHQLIDQNIENVKALNGRSLSFKNPLKSVISLKSVDLMKIDNFSCKYTRR